MKHHFKVSNSYVVKKLALVLFPWRHKPWARKTYRTESGQAEWLPPRDDINSPDLYIPRTCPVRAYTRLLNDPPQSWRLSPTSSLLRCTRA